MPSDRSGARTVLAGPYRAPVAPRSALPGFTRTMAPHSMWQAGSRQANTLELTSRGPRTGSRMDRAGCAVSCGRPWYSRTQLLQRSQRAQASGAVPASREQRLQAHGSRKAARMRVTGAHIAWRALQFRCGSARKPPRSSRTSTQRQSRHTHCTAKSIQILGMNLIYLVLAPGRSFWLRLQLSIS